MTCREFRLRADTLVDGELEAAVTLEARAHQAGCSACRRVAEQAHRLRQLLRRQPREAASPELRARILASCRREARRARVARWIVVPALAGAAAALLAVWALDRPGPAPALSHTLVAIHLAFTDLERPAEFASRDREEIASWLDQRVGLRLTVPDYSSAGLRVLGTRLVTVGGRKAALVLYEKGHLLLSVAIVPAPARDLGGERTIYRGRAYLTSEDRGHRSVLWSDGEATFGLVAMLSPEAILECADKLRMERETRRSL